MKKNLRIVSAAAAALLAVAPVAATVVPAASARAAVVGNSYDQNMGKLDDGTLDAQTGTVNLQQIAYKNYNDVNAIQYAITNDVKKQLKDNRGNISATIVNEKSNVDPSSAAKSSVTYTFTVKRTGVTLKHENEAVKAKGANHLYWNAKGELLSASGTPAQFSVTVFGNSTVSADSPATPAVPDTTTPSESINAGEGTDSIFDADNNLFVTINAVSAQAGRPSAISGNITANIDGQTVTALLHGNANTTVYEKNPLTTKGQKAVDATKLHSKGYFASINGATLNLGNKYAGKDVKLVLPKNAWFSNGTRVLKTNADNNGTVTLGTIVAKFYAYDATNLRGIHFYAVKTGEQVQNGSVALHAVNGNLNVESVFAAINSEYGAAQYINNADIEPASTVNDFRDQLKKQNIEVGPHGYFKAPASFTLNLTAKSNKNGATASMPVTVTVDNAAQTPAAQETTKTVKIMHIATIYDKNGKATHEPALRAYNTVSVVSDPVSLKDEKGNDAGKFYKLAGKDQYIKVGNVDGTSRSLKHNSYVYKSTGKRRGKTVLKKGSSVTTYGKSFMIAGHQMYRIGENQYVKKANF